MFWFCTIFTIDHSFLVMFLSCAPFAKLLTNSFVLLSKSYPGKKRKINQIFPLSCYYFFVFSIYSKFTSNCLGLYLFCFLPNNFQLLYAVIPAGPEISSKSSYPAQFPEFSGISGFLPQMFGFVTISPLHFISSQSSSILLTLNQFFPQLCILL